MFRLRDPIIYFPFLDHIYIYIEEQKVYTYLYIYIIYILYCIYYFLYIMYMLNILYIYMYIYIYIIYIHIFGLFTSRERRHWTLFSQSALISQSCLHFFEKLKYYDLGNKDYSKKINLGCNRCGCQCSWRLGYCKASHSAQEQIHYEFYWPGCENLSNLITFKAVEA